MKLLLFGLLWGSISFSAEPPPSPRDGADAGKKAFIKRLQQKTLEQEQRIKDLAAVYAQQRIEARRQACLEGRIHSSNDLTPQMTPEWFANNEACYCRFQ